MKLGWTVLENRRAILLPLVPVTRQNVLIVSRSHGQLVCSRYENAGVTNFCHGTENSASISRNR